eukprot:scaffold2558_cov172-Amphora_coffeaeformis.AAC.10
MKMNTDMSITESSDDDGSAAESSRRQHPQRGEDPHGEEEDGMLEILQDLSRRQPMNSTEEDPLDPIEWTVRKLVPIPETYFWEYSPKQGVALSSEWKKKLPWRLKAWHRTIGTVDSGMKWMDRWIAQPVAAGTGLTAPRMSYVTDFMTEEEWEASRQRLRERKGRVLHDSETGDGLVLKTTAGQPIKEDRMGLESVQISSDER